MEPVLIYTHQQTPRLRYILDLMLGQLLGLSYQLTTDPEHYLTHQGPVINYSKKGLRTGELHIIPHTLLFEAGIKDQAIIVEQRGQNPVFFQAGPSSFDLFAASFYLVSRYEEC
ncbi:MAG: hypothetical protein KDC44_20285 [Phaeodactylibacter sp.]|nr:hypothetical protein [Phaeodactylibacter sp.]